MQFASYRKALQDYLAWFPFFIFLNSTYYIKLSNMRIISRWTGRICLCLSYGVHWFVKHRNRSIRKIQTDIRMNTGLISVSFSYKTYVSFSATILHLIMRVTWLHMKNYNIQWFTKYFVNAEKQMTITLHIKHYALYTELISIVTTNHYLGDFHQPRKVFKHFFFEKPNPFVLTGKE